MSPRYRLQRGRLAIFLLDRSIYLLLAFQTKLVVFLIKISHMNLFTFQFNSVFLYLNVNCNSVSFVYIYRECSPTCDPRCWDRCQHLQDLTEIGQSHWIDRWKSLNVRLGWVCANLWDMVWIKSSHHCFFLINRLYQLWYKHYSKIPTNSHFFCHMLYTVIHLYYYWICPGTSLFLYR